MLVMIIVDKKLVVLAPDGQHVFAQGKTLHFYAKTALYGAVICTQGRCERFWRNVPARRACGTDERQNSRLKFVLPCLDFWRPYKTPSFQRENGGVRCCALYTREEQALLV